MLLWVLQSRGADCPHCATDELRSIDFGCPRQILHTFGMLLSDWYTCSLRRNPHNPAFRLKSASWLKSGKMDNAQHHYSITKERNRLHYA